MHLLAWILGFSVLGSLLSVAAAAVYLLLPQRVRERSLNYLISFATGMLLGAGFLHLLPEALQVAAAQTERLMATVLVAILTFFLLEKGLIWRHHHHTGEANHRDGRVAHGTRPAGALILVGDSFHNFLDGALITAAFVADFRLGVVTALAVIAHEIPQELGDFAILLHSGYTRARAFTLNLLTSLAMVVGVGVAWVALDFVAELIPYLLAFTAASFIYVAVSDLMPSLNRTTQIGDTIVQLALIGCGLAFNAFVHG
jgi:zinc and cadmium transporter